MTLKHQRKETNFISNPVNPIRILLVDDHALVRESLSQTLSENPDFQIVGLAEDAQVALMLAEKTIPDVIIMDIDMPGMICFDAAKRISAQLPHARLIFLSAFVHDRYIEQAIMVGARGYLTKHEPTEKFVEAIRASMRGSTYFSPQVWKRLVVDEKGFRVNSSTPSRSSTLTVRELEVLRYLANGLSKKEVARMMHVSPKTVEVHTTNMMNKLGIHKQVELARFALREGLTHL